MSALVKRSELPFLFGEIERNPGPNMKAWPDEEKHMVSVDLPPAIAEKTGHRHLYVNRWLAGLLLAAFGNVLERGLLAQLVTIDGCFMIRPQRGDLLRLSVHSWGMAIDLNATINQLGTKGNMTPEFVRCFTDVGFVWGGNWHRPDPMHFQLVEED